MQSYNDADWRLVPETMPPAVLYGLLRKILPKLALQYSTPHALNGLFTWTNYVEPWPLRAFVLRHGIWHPIAHRSTTREIAELLGKSTYATQQAYGKQGALARLTAANELLRGAPELVRGQNKLRAIGLEPGIWTRLASHGVYTPFGLAKLSPRNLHELHLSEHEIADIRACLASVGLTAEM